MVKTFIKYALCSAIMTLGAVNPANAAGARSAYASEIAKYVYPENAAASPANFVYMPDGLS